MMDSIEKMPKWHFKVIFLALLMILFLLGTWFFSYTRPLWDRIDSFTFEFCNRWIRNSSFWQQFWAFTNHPIMDWIHDIVMLIFFFYAFKWTPKSLRLRKIAELLFSIMLVAITLICINEFFFHDYIHMKRKSPSLVVDSATLLSDKIDWFKVKDHSNSSFPGDHGTTALLFIGIVFRFIGWRTGFLATAYAVFFCLPRLITGAHWLSDVVVGSGSIALFAIAWGLYSPIAPWVVNLIETMFNKIRGLFHYEKQKSC